MPSQHSETKDNAQWAVMYCKVKHYKNLKHISKLKYPPMYCRNFQRSQNVYAWPCMGRLRYACSFHGFFVGIEVLFELERWQKLLAVFFLFRFISDSCYWWTCRTHRCAWFIEVPLWISFQGPVVFSVDRHTLWCWRRYQGWRWRQGRQPGPKWWRGQSGWRCRLKHAGCGLHPLQPRRWWTQHHGVWDCAGCPVFHQGERQHRAWMLPTGEALWTSSSCVSTSDR